MSEEVKIGPVHTCCYGCVFSEGAPQTGCSLGRIEKYMGQGVVIEAENENGQFFIVNRTCNAFRPAGSAWSSEYEGRERERVEEENRVRCGFVVLADDGDVHSTLLAAEEHEPPPSEVVLVTRTDGGRLQKLLADFPVPCKVVRCLEENPSEARLVDLGVARLERSGWYAVLLSGEGVPDGLIAGLDDAINEKVDRFSVLTPTGPGPHGLVCHVPFHRSGFISGNSPCDIDGREVEWVWEKALDYAERANKPFLVKPVGEVCASPE